MDAILRFIWRSILTFLFLFFAPAILLIVPLPVVHYYPGDDTIRLLKVLLGVLGPFAASFWFLLSCEFPKFYAAARDGGHVNGGIGFHLKAIGKMVFAFLMSGAFAFYVGAPRFNIASSESDSLWFVEMYLAVFSPIFLLLGWRLIKRAYAGRQTCKCCRERVGGANLDELGLCSYCRADALNEQETDEEQEAWIRKVEKEFGDKQWAAELRNGRRTALRWKRRLLSSR
jgi:amino acid permease